MTIDNKITAQFQMIGSRIVSLSLKNDSISADIIRNGNRKLEMAHEVMSIEKHDSGDWIGVVQLHVTVRVSQEGGKYTIKLVLEGGFSAPQEMEESLFQRMLSMNGIASLYGIARAQISTFTTLSFADCGIVLPMIDVTKYSKRIEDKKTVTYKQEKGKEEY